MENYDETSNYLDNAIPTMKHSEGSGPEGTAELLSLAEPLLAAAQLTPVGRALGGAAATLALAPQEAEAGILGILGRTKRSGFNLIEDGAAVFPDMTRNIEFPTNAMAKVIEKGRGIKLSEVAKGIMQPGSIDKFSDWDKGTLASYMKKLYNIPKHTRTHAGMMKSSEVTETTNAFYEHPTQGTPYGKVVVKRTDKQGNQVPFEDMAGSTTHELTHALDESDPIIGRILRQNGDKLDYNFNLGENRAFISGYRHNFDKSLTDPSSKDFVHPMLSYAGGKVGAAPFNDFVSNIADSYKAIGKTVDKNFLINYSKALKAEKERLQYRVDTDPTFKAKLDKAVKHTTDSNADWNLGPSQKKALANQRVEDEIMRHQEEMALKATLIETKE